MTYLQLSGAPLVVPPYLSLKRQEAVGDPGVDQYIYPKLAKAPKKIKPSKSLNKMALITDLRTLDTPDAIGATGESAPSDGIKIISPNDRFVLLGGSTTTGSKLYEKAGPLYVNTHLLVTSPAIPDFIKFAVFTLDMKHLACVFNSAPTKIQIYVWSSSDPLDPNGQWNLDTPIETSQTITQLTLTAAGSFLIANLGNFTFVCYRVSTMAQVTPVPTGSYATCVPNETEWLIAVNGGSVNVYGVVVATGAFTLNYTLSTSTGSERKIRYSPNGNVLMMHGKAASGTAMPRFWAKRGNRWFFIRSDTKANATTQQTAQWIMKADSTQVITSYCNSNGTSPKVDAYKPGNVTPDLLVDDSNPWTGAGSPEAGARPERSAAGDIVATANQVKTYDFDSDTWTDVTPASNYATATGVAISQDGVYVMSVKAAGVNLWTRAGNVLTVATVPTSDVPAQLLGGALNRDGSLMALSGRATGTNIGQIQIFKRTGTTWAAMGAAIAVTGAGATIALTVLRAHVEFHPTRDDCFVTLGFAGAGSGTTPRFFKLVSGTWTEVTTPFPYAVGYTGLFGDGEWSPNGLYFAMITRDNTFTGYKMQIFAMDATTLVFTLYAAVSPSPLYTGSPGGGAQLVWSVDAKVIAMTLLATASSPLRLFMTGSDPLLPVVTAYTTMPASLTLTTPSGIIFSSGTFTIWNNTGVNNHFLYSNLTLYPSYVLDYQFVPTINGLCPLDGYDFAQTIINFGVPTFAQHPFSTPLTPSPTYPSQLGYAPSHAITDVYGVVLSLTGKTVLYQVAPSGDIFVAARPNAGSSFLSSENLQATFVDVYDLVGSTYVERNYSTYEYQTDVHDIVFSPNEEVLTYHVTGLVTAPVDQPKGRLVYDVSGTNVSQNFTFRGQVWESQMTNSYVCFSPFNTEFVVVHEHAVTNDPFISLHEFVPATGYTYLNQDTKTVPFGPADWSICDDIVVAHGGTPPLDFFHHDDPGNLLVPFALDLAGWTNDDTILDIAWSPDCKDLMVLEPDGLVPLVDDGDDDGSKTPGDKTPIEPVDDTGDTGDQGKIDWDTDDDIHVIRTGDGKGGTNSYPGYHHWDHYTHEVVNISYIPYVVQTITFRQYSVPE